MFGTAIVLAACTSAAAPSESTPPVAEEPIPETTTTVALADGVFVGVDGVETMVAGMSRIVSLTGAITEIIFVLRSR